MKKYLIAAGFLSCIPLANWMIGNVGTICIPNGPCLIPVAPGLMAPSGVAIVGAALVLRDAVQETFGVRVAAALVLVGAILSLAVSSPALAFASGVAFLLSETLDLAVYSRFRRRGLATAVALSGVVGAAIDTAVFSCLAFGSMSWQPGLLLGKLYATGLAAAYLRWCGTSRTNEGRI